MSEWVMFAGVKAGWFGFWTGSWGFQSRLFTGRSETGTVSDVWL